MIYPCLDHLVIAADTLSQGAEFLRSKLGVALQPGGQHVRQGTHNMLLRLDKERYLEVIAIDPAGDSPINPRWFGLDSLDLQVQIRQQPRLITWVARTDAIHTAVKKCIVDIGPVCPMSRGQLNWQITIPKDGALIYDGQLPALIQWEDNPHPATHMLESGCSLEALEGYHQNPGALQSALSSLELETEIKVKPVLSRAEVCLKAKIMTPGGLVVLD
jgi:hypothetical protein